jgi:hypothetical protein
MPGEESIPIITERSLWRVAERSMLIKNTVEDLDIMRWVCTSAQTCGETDTLWSMAEVLQKEFVV